MAISKNSIAWWKLPEVSQLGISTHDAEVGQAVTITAQVTNNGTGRAVYPASLWLNETVEDTQSVIVEAGETREFSFTYNPSEEGTYEVRVDRLFESLSVSAQPEPTATSVPPTATAIVPVATPVTTVPSPTSVPPAPSVVPTRTVTAPTSVPPTAVPPAATATVEQTVIAATPTSTPVLPPIVEESGGGIGAGAIIGIIVAILVIAGALGGYYFYYMKRRESDNLPGF
jgi:hypothetical protein